MPALLTSLTTEQVAALRRGDEQVLELLVRSRFPAVVERAREALREEAGAASRVAVKVMLSLWEAREQLATPADVDEFLEEVVAARSADELRRRASLHRFERHEGVEVGTATVRSELSPDEAWREIHAHLHVSAEELAEHREEARKLAKHHASEHLGDMGRRRIPFGMIAVGAVLLALAAWGLRYMDRGSAELALTRALESEDARVLRASAGQRGTVTLRDESTAQMAAGTNLRVAADFGGAVRGLELDGAAAFIVAPDRSPAFEVRTRGVAVVATGTAFDVRAYHDEPEIIVRVNEGSVSVRLRNDTGESHDVAAGDAIAVSDAGTVRTPTARELQRAFSWTTGTLVLDDMAVDQVLVLLRRWHDVDAELDDSSLGARKVTVELTLESAGEALDVFTRAAKLAITYDGTQMVLRDASTAAPVRTP